MAQSHTLKVAPGSELHKRIIDGVRDRIRFSQRAFASRRAKWRQNEEAALAFLPERDVDAQRRLAREGGKPQYTTVVIPYSYGILMATHTYFTTVFLSRNPIFQFSGRHGESEQQIQAVEALADYQVSVGGMLVPLYIWLLDAPKYGVGIVGIYWDEEFTNITQIVEETENFLGVIPTGKKRKVRKTERVRGFTGNRLYNVRPYDFFPDPRVPLLRFQEGEFCGAYIELGWNQVLARRDAGLYTNVEKLSGKKDMFQGAREQGSPELQLPLSDDTTIDLSIDSRKVSDVVKGFECHIDLVPKEWKISDSDQPEKWVFTVTADFQLVIGAQPLGAYHNKFPFHAIEFEPEGYGIVPRGLPEISKPIQDTLDWLLNSHFYNVRKTLNNQFIVDPSRIVMKDVEDPWPGGTIRMAPAGYGGKIGDAIHQFAVTDVTRAHITDMNVMLEIGQRAHGVSDQILGMLNIPGGRKTATEVRTASTFGVNRLKTVAEYFSAMGWAPLSQMLVQNSQQHYELETKFKLVGDLAQQAGPQFIEVNPESIQGFYDFVPVDGTLPVDRFAQANLWRELFAQLRNFPEVAQQYDLGKIFAFVAQLAGLKNINQFKTQMMPDAAVQQQAQAGNLIPMPGRAERDLSRVPEPGQIGGMGATG